MSMMSKNWMFGIKAFPFFWGFAGANKKPEHRLFVLSFVLALRWSLRHLNASFPERKDVVPM